MKNIIILENIRSAYNVWNVIRTADALNRDVRLSGYTPSPKDSAKVRKTALWAEENVNITRFDQPQDALIYASQLQIKTLAAEITKNALSLEEAQSQDNGRIAVVFGNEVDGVQQNTLEEVDNIVYIPMLWIKESLNIGQSAAIFMWALK